MRILHLDPDDMANPLSGGGPVRTFELYRRLAQRHEITVLTPTFPGSTPALEREGVRYRRLGRKVGEHGSSHHITYFFSLPRAVREHDYDLLVEDFMPPCSATMTPLFKRRRPLVASVQWFFARELARRYHLPFQLGESWGLRLYRNFVVLTERMRALVASRHPRARCAVIPNAVDASLFDLPQRPGGDFILFLGQVNLAQKGVDLLLHAYARIPAAERLPLVLAGHGFQGDAVRALLTRLDLDAWVRLPGRVDAQGRAELLAGCRFVCVPSREETFGMVIAEACAAAKRVIAFDRWPMSEVAPRGPCVLVPAFEVPAYAQAMRGLLREGEHEMLAAGRQCRDAVRRYTWDRAAAAQEAFYMEVAHERR